MSKREPRRKGAHFWKKARKEEVVVSDPSVFHRIGRRIGKTVTVEDLLRGTLACGPVWTCSRCGARTRSPGKPGHFRQPVCETFLLKKIMDS